MEEIFKFPKKLQRTLLHLKRDGVDAEYVFPAFPKRYMDEKSMALARMGMLDEMNIRSWLVATKKDLIFVKAGVLRNREDKIPLDAVTDVEYVKEFHDNTIKIRIGERAEDVRFFEEVDGVRFYKFMKNKEWKNL